MLKRDPTLQKALDSLASMIGFLPQDEAETKGLCVRCKESVKAFTDELSERDYNITGFCQKCQDIIYAEPEEDEDD